MDVREMLVDGVQQLNDWMLQALEGLTPEQVNWLPPGNTTSIGFSAWHVWRTTDNIVNFVLQNRKPTIWLEKGYCDRLGLPKVEQGTGMSIEDARALTITDPGLLCEYGREVGAAAIEYIKNVPLEELDEVQLIRPLGEMSRGKVLRQVVMTHGFMHLGEINLIKGALGMKFGI
ncbi:hypothetical protein HRbin29_01448 [bacterium HR29]|nr:hypothetical protein HRbin29_01448 [bacterium HR29]